MAKRLLAPRISKQTYIYLALPVLMDDLIKRRCEEQTKKNPSVRCERMSEADVINEGIILLLKKEGLITKGHVLW